jgi:hypothetical protein
MRAALSPTYIYLYEGVSNTLNNLAALDSRTEARESVDKIRTRPLRAVHTLK